MYYIKNEDKYKIAPIFEGWDETMIWSGLQGYKMSNVWADDIHNPKSAQIVTGDICFFGGIPDSALVKNIPEYFRSEAILMVPQNEEWGELIEKEYNLNCKKIMRYAIKKEPEIFSVERLKSYVDKLPEKYRINRIDREIYHKTGKENWSKDLCAQFSTYDEYEELGLGFVIIYNNEIVSGASSYSVYNKGIEIEIDTKPEFRRKGLALVCASCLILECLKRNLYPSWDAANKESVALAEKLGYHFDREYVTYSVSNFR